MVDFVTNPYVNLLHNIVAAILDVNRKRSGISSKTLRTPSGAAGGHMKSLSKMVGFAVTLLLVWSRGAAEEPQDRACPPRDRPRLRARRMSRIPLKRAALQNL